MLPPFIIEQIRQREDQKRWEERPRLELPLDGMMPPVPMAPPHGTPPQGESDEGPRGVVILDI